MTKKSIAYNLLFFLTALTFPAVSRAANITLQGEFTADDNVQLFSILLSAPATVDLRSYGYAGGTTSTGIATPRGGFDPFLTLFDGAGSFLDANDDGEGVATDPFTGFTSDAQITANLAAGNYLLALTQYDNFSLGNLADGFLQTGFPNFTADPSFTAGDPCAGNLFRDISGTLGRCRAGSWTVDFINVTSVTTVAPVPEPAAFMLTGLGLGILLAAANRGRNRRNTTLLTSGLVAALAVVPVHAQTPPDYSNTSDFLRGQRNLLKVTDLQIVGSYGSEGRPATVYVNTSNSQQANSDVYYLPPLSVDNEKPKRNYSARMFDQPRAATITPLYNYNRTARLTLWIQNVVSYTAPWQPFAAGDEPDLTGGAIADFSSDGYDDLAFSTADGRMVVVTPKDVTNADAGFRQSIAHLDVLTAMTAGDFNGEGQPEIAGLAVLPSGGMKLVIYSVDSKTLEVTTASSLTLTTPGATESTPVLRASIARGRFNGAAHDQLAVTFATATSGAYVEVIDFTPGTLEAIEGPQHKATVAGVTHEVGYIELKTGKFGLPENPFDQIVYHNSSATTASGSRFFQVQAADPVTFAITAKAPVLYDEYPCASGIEVGNFDHRQADPLHPDQTEPNLNDQVALMYCTDGLGLGHAIYIYSPDPATLDLLGPDSMNILPLLNVNPTFVATDLQGRSLVLGDPTVFDMNNVSMPSVVVGAPPMHADFISSTPGSVPPALLNLSAVWDVFTTTYDNETSDQHPTTDSQKTS